MLLQNMSKLLCHFSITVFKNADLTSHLHLPLAPPPSHLLPVNLSPRVGTTVLRTYSLSVQAQSSVNQTLVSHLQLFEERGNLFTVDHKILVLKYTVLNFWHV